MTVPCKEVIVEEPIEGFSIPLNSGWNYISCPLNDVRTIGEIFGDKINYPLYHYWGGYKSKQSGDKLIEGAGIMVNVLSATTVTFLGEPINTAIYLASGPLLAGYPYLYEKPVSEYSAVYTNFNPKYHCLGEHTGFEVGVRIRFLSGYRDNKYQQIADCGAFTYTHETPASVYGFIDGSISAFITCTETKEGVEYAEEKELEVMHCFGACEGNVSTGKQCTIPLGTFKLGKAHWIFK